MLYEVYGVKRVPLGIVNASDMRDAIARAEDICTDLDVEDYEAHEYYPNEEDR